MSLVGCLALASSVFAADGTYAYGGYAARDVVGGIAATVTPLAPSNVVSGHVAAWVGVGGPGEGPDGTDAWAQIGLAAFPNGTTDVYVELKRGTFYRFIPVAASARVGTPYRLAVVRTSNGAWRPLLNGRAVGAAIRLELRRTNAVATAESWTIGPAGSCNSFSYRFTRVSMRTAADWRSLSGAPLSSRSIAIAGSGKAFVSRSHC